VTRILVGTASWTDTTLVKDGHFHPPEAKSAEARLTSISLDCRSALHVSSPFAPPESCRLET